MSDDEDFQRALRDLIQRDLPPAAPPELRASLPRISDSRPPARLSSRWRRTGRRVAVGVAAVTVVSLMGALVLSTQPIAGPLASPLASGSAVPAGTTFAPALTASAHASSVVGPEVDAFGLIDSEHGWVLSESRIYLTADGGRTWSFALDAEQGSSPLTAFLDAQHGWVVPLRTVENGPAAVLRTVDGGRTWQEARTPSVYGHPEGLTFFDPDRGLLAFDGGGSRPGSLWSSSDGGATWARVASLPIAVVGSVSFSDPENGWAFGASDLNPPTGRAAINELYVTNDGGSTWRRAVLPAPPDGWTADAWLPVFQSMPSVFVGGAVVSIWYGNGNSGETQLLVTHDAGATWNVAATIPSVFPVTVDALDARTWIAASPDGGAAGRITLKVTTDGGLTWGPIGDVRAGGGFYLQIAFVDRLHGWVSGDSDVASLQLYATDDGGATWRLLSPSGGPTRTPAPCSADNVGLGAWPTPASGPRTPWFNVFAMNFDPTKPITISFDRPVIAWPGEGAPSGPIETLTVMPASDGSAKLSFRPAESGVKRIVVRIEGASCSASTTVDLTASAP